MGNLFAAPTNANVEAGKDITPSQANALARARREAAARGNLPNSNVISQNYLGLGSAPPPEVTRDPRLMVVDPTTGEKAPIYDPNYNRGVGASMEMLVTPDFHSQTHRTMARRSSSGQASVAHRTVDSPLQPTRRNWCKRTINFVASMT